MQTDIDPTEASAAAIFLLAIVQGLAEFLPVSSSGHLVLARVSLDVHEAGLALDVALHVGTLLAVAWAYRREVFQLFADLAHGKLVMWGWLILATVPVGVVGILAKDLVERAATDTHVAGIGLLCTAVFLMFGEWGRSRQEKQQSGDPDGDALRVEDYGRPRWSDALVLGCAQAIAVVPGISRSGITISAGLLRGLPVAQAARLSFMMSLPAVSGAAIVELPGAVQEGFGGLSTSVVLGAIALAAFVGWAALQTLLIVMKRGAFRWFAIYCALLGSLALTLT